MKNVIVNQSIKNVLYSSLGLGLGFISAGLIYPNIFETEEIGLLGIMFGLAYIMSELNSFGMHNVITKMFPYFRNDEKKHNGFFSIVLFVGIMGTLSTILTLYLFQPVFNKMFSNDLFRVHYSLMYPLVICTLFFGLFENFYKVHFNISTAGFLREVLYRILMYVWLLLFFFKIISFDFFIYAYIISFFIPLSILVTKLYINKHISLSWNKGFISKNMRKEMITVGLYGILVGVCVSANLHLDKILVGSLLTIQDLGIYTTAFTYGTIIAIPARSINKIVSVYVSEAWKNKDIDSISKLYKSTSQNQTIIGALLFLLLWANIDSLFVFLPDVFVTGKYVIFFIGLSGVAEMASGAINSVLYTSPDFKYQAFANILYLILIFLFGYFLVPIWGISGAAATMTLAMTFYQASRIFFVYKRYKIQPFNFKHIVVISCMIALLLFQYTIPHLPIVILDVFVRSIILIFAYIFLLINLVSFPELETMIEKVVPSRIFKLGWRSEGLVNN